MTDPERPELLRFLDGPPNTWTLQVQVADGAMITALEHPPPGLTIGDANAAPKDGFLIWDVRAPDRPTLLGHWTSGAAGTHRNFYNGGRFVDATTTMPGFDGHILAIVDISDPQRPTTVSTWWYPGQNTAAGERYTAQDERRLTAGRPYSTRALSLHGAAYPHGDRAYCPWMRAGMVIRDIADKQHPRHVSTLSVSPPLGSSIAVHSAVPLAGRAVVVINSEALQEHCQEPVSYAATVNVSDETDPMMMASFPTPRPRAGTTHRASAPKAAASGRTTNTSSKAWRAWHPTTTWSISPTSTPGCRSSTCKTRATPTSSGTTSPTIRNSDSGQCQPRSCTRPRTYWWTDEA